VTLLDANVLLYAYDSTSAQHEVAAKWLAAALSGAEPTCFSWMTLIAFVRIATNPRAVQRPLRVEDACAIVSSWLDQPCVSVLTPGDRHWAILSRLLVESQASGPLAMDAHLAALAIEHGAVMVTSDRDFRRFDGLKILDPLEGGR
jgi:toxin-antitoxin system PIN domain toxin